MDKAVRPQLIAPVEIGVSHLRSQVVEFSRFALANGERANLSVCKLTGRDGERIIRQCHRKSFRAVCGNAHGKRGGAVRKCFVAPTKADASEAA